MRAASCASAASAIAIDAQATRTTESSPESLERCMSGLRSSLVQLEYRVIADGTERLRPEPGAYAASRPAGLLRNPMTASEIAESITRYGGRAGDRKSVV